MRHARLSLAASLLCVILFSAAPSAAQQDAGVASKVDEYVKAEMQRQRIPGVALAVVRDGQVLLARGYGLANVEHQVPVKPETVFQSGSVGKQFTSMLVLMLAEEGKLSLDDPVTKYLTDAPEAWKGITVRHLLTHTAGTTDYPRDFDFRRDYTEDELLKRAYAVPLASRPGEKWSYSNLGYVVLGILIHKASGKFYGDLLQERVFRPLGMTTARNISEADIIPNRASGYRLVGGELKNQEWVSPSINMTADGSLYLTVHDMAKWDAALHTEKLLKRASLAEMWTPVKLADGKTHPYGFAWALGEVRGHRYVAHGGAWQGFKAYITRFADDRLSVIVFANLAQANVERIGGGVAAIYNAELAPPAAPAATAATEDKEPRVTALLKELIRKFGEGTADPELFTPEARAAIFPERARQVAEAMKNFGPLNSVQFLERRDEAGIRAYSYRVVFANVTLVGTLALTAEDKIAGIAFRPE